MINQYINSNKHILLAALLVLLLSNQALSQKFSKTYKKFYKEANSAYQDADYNRAFELYDTILLGYPYHIESMLRYADIAVNFKNDCELALEKYHILVPILEDENRKLLSDPKASKKERQRYRDLLESAEKGQRACQSTTQELEKEEPGTKEEYEINEEQSTENTEDNNLPPDDQTNANDPFDNTDNINFLSVHFATPLIEVFGTSEKSKKEFIEQKVIEHYKTLPQAFPSQCCY